MAFDNAFHDVSEAGFRYPVKYFSSLAFFAQHPPILENTQMLAHHVARNPAGLGKFTHRSVTLQQKLDYLQADGVGDGSQAFGGALQNLIFQEIFLDEYYTFMHNKESIYRELSICQPYFSVCHIVLPVRSILPVFSGARISMPL